MLFWILLLSVAVAVVLYAILNEMGDKKAATLNEARWLLALLLPALAIGSLLYSRIEGAAHRQHVEDMANLGYTQNDAGRWVRIARPIVQAAKQSDDESTDDHVRDGDGQEPRAAEVRERGDPRLSGPDVSEP